MSSAALDSGFSAPRSRLVAAILSLIAPGAGHLYAGAPRRGLVAFLILLIAPAPVLLAAAMMTPPAFKPAVILSVAAIALFALIYLAIMIDVVRSVGRAADAPRVAWPMLIVAVIGVWLAHYAVSFVSPMVRLNMPWRTFTVASSSMEPTLRINEWLIGDATYFAKNQPARGDVVVYRLPSDNTTIYIKRIVALPGDRIAFRDGHVVINGVTAAEPFADFGDAKAFYNNTAEVTVPADHVFAAGDNRANSSDSRVKQHGMIPMKNLVARATEIFLTEDGARAGLWVGTAK